MDPSSELVDIIDDDDRVIKVVTRAQMRKENLLHRGTFIVVKSSDGRLLVHQRSNHKDVWANFWDIAVGGVVGSNETYLQAAEREVFEEIGVDAHGKLQEIGSGIFKDSNVQVRGVCFRLTHDGPFTFEDGEVVQSRLVTPSELAELLNSESFVPDSLRLLAPIIGSEWSNVLGL